MEVKWLSALEKQVEAATKELLSLRKENKSQKSKIDKLESDLAAAKSASVPASDWENERREIRDRVEKLSKTLDKLL